MLKGLVTPTPVRQRLFVVDTFCGANENSRLKVRFVMEVALAGPFRQNMFIRPTEAELSSYGEPDFVVNASKTSDPIGSHGLNSGSVHRVPYDRENADHRRYLVRRRDEKKACSP